MGSPFEWGDRLEHDALEVEGQAALELGSWRARTGEKDLVTAIERHGWIHVHRLWSPDEVTLRGWGVAELVCHACHAGTYVVHLAVDETIAGVPLGPQSVRDLTFRFAKLHGSCDTPGNGKSHRSRCSPTRAHLRVIDLRLFAAGPGAEGTADA